MTIGVAPSFDVLGLTLAWHGIFTALGLLVGYVCAWVLAPRLRLDRQPLEATVLVACVAGLIGARLWYLVETDPAGLLTPWAGGTTGFSFWGSVLLGGPAMALTLRVLGVPVLAYLDLVAVAFLAGMAVGRVADLLNGEHYGPPTDLPWGVTYTNAGSHVPTTGVAYHSGALYEIVLVAGLFVLGLVVLRARRRPGNVFWAMLGGYAAARFAVFFFVRDADVVAIGLRQAQLTSIGLVLAAAAGFTLTRRKGAHGPSFRPRR